MRQVSFFCTYLCPMPPIYATATHIPSGEVTCTFGPFETLHAARVAVSETVDSLLTWEHMTIGGYAADNYPTLWVVENRETALAPQGSTRKPYSA